MTTSAYFRHARYDVIVVGARVAGSATAALLAGAGLRVLLVDRQPYGADTLSTHALMRGGVLLLAQWGLLPAVIAAGTPPIKTTTFGYGGETVEVPIKPDGVVDALYAPRRTVLDPILADAAWNAGAEVRYGSILLDLVRAGDGRVIGALLKDPEGRVHQVGAALVVGADGIGSTVARRAGAEVIAHGRASTATLYAYVPASGASGYRWLYGEAASVGVIPTNGGLDCVFVSVPTARFDTEFRDEPVAGFTSVLKALDPNLAATAAVPNVALNIFRGRTGFLRRASGPGWALVGDAGFYRDPLTAHGMTDALRFADGLARAVIDGGTRAMAAFVEERDRDSLTFLEATDAIASYRWSMDELKELHRRLSALMKAEASAIMARMPQRAPAGEDPERAVA